MPDVSTGKLKGKGQQLECYKKNYETNIKVKDKSYKRTEGPDMFISSLLKVGL